MNELRILIFIFAITTSYSRFIPNSMDYLSDEELRYNIYLEEIKQYTNLTADPCDNFKAYACGRMPRQHKSRSPTINLRSKHLDQIKKFMFNIKNKTKVEEKLINLYKTCEDQHNIEEIFEQIKSLRNVGKWPVQNEPTMKEIALILGELSAFDSSLFRVIISQGIVFPIHDIKIYSQHEVEYMMNQINHKHTILHKNEIEKASEEIVELTKIMYSFTNQTNQTLLNNQSNTIPLPNGINDLKILIPNFEWDIYFEGLFNLLNIPINDGNKYIKGISNIETAKHLIDIFNTYDKKVIMNKLIFRYVKFLSSFECSDLIPFFRPTILKRIWDDVLTEEVKIEQLNYLIEFEEMLNEITSKTQYHSVDKIMELINKKKHIIINHSKILNDQILADYYSNLNVDSEQFYLNYLKLAIFLLDIFQPTLKEFNNNKLPNIQMSLNDDLIKVFEGQYDFVIHPNLKGKPRLFQFTTDNIYLWKKFFENNPVWRNYTVAEECLSQQNEDRSVLENTSYMDAFASNRITYLEFLEYLKDNKEILQNVEKIIERYGLGNMQKVYFLSLFQNICHMNKKQYDTTLLQVLKHSEIFNEIFQCPVNSKMNKISGKICRIHECSSYEGKFVLRPYIFPKCLQQAVGLDRFRRS